MGYSGLRVTRDNLLEASIAQKATILRDKRRAKHTDTQESREMPINERVAVSDNQWKINDDNRRWRVYLARPGVSQVERRYVEITVEIWIEDEGDIEFKRGDQWWGPNNREDI